MIMSVSTLIIGRGAATPRSVVNFCIVRCPSGRSGHDIEPALPGPVLCHGGPARTRAGYSGFLGLPSAKGRGDLRRLPARDHRPDEILPVQHAGNDDAQDMADDEEPPQIARAG